jgi:hypothetical protein
MHLHLILLQFHHSHHYRNVYLVVEEGLRREYIHYQAKLLAIEWYVSINFYKNRHLLIIDYQFF